MVRLLSIKKELQKFNQAGDTRYIYRNELDKACFQHDSAYADTKDLINRAYDIASNPEYDGYQRGLASMVYKFFDKKTMGSGAAEPSSLERVNNESLIFTNELHKPIITKCIRFLQIIFGVLI